MDSDSSSSSSSDSDYIRCFSARYAFITDFPWQVSIRRNIMGTVQRSRPTMSRCGGTLINTNVIFTAAQCTKDHTTTVELPKEHFIISAGHTSVFYKARELPASYEDLQERDIKSIIVHP